MTKNEILISVIIPTYKRADLLPKAVDSVLEQTYQNIEIIVVDDNDPGTEYRNATELIMQKYFSDKRVKYLQHERNTNGAAARNTGIKNAKGEFICFLDDDDWFLPEKIEKQKNFLLNNPLYEGVYCGRYQNNKIITCTLTGNLSEIILLSKFIPGPPTLMIKKSCLEFIGGFNENYRRHQDSELLLRFFEHFKIGSVPEPLVEIGVNLAENELHGLELERLKADLFCDFDKIITRLTLLNKNFKKNVYSKHYSQTFLDHIQNGYYTLALKLFIRQYRFSPLFFSKWLIFNFIDWLKFKTDKIFFKSTANPNFA